ncbi:hypothetical protein CIHG_02954 [Coccidioides immitis H538.4]|uniref:Uncharacterized protein n=2 Tax=Coccidioides immitis TaxID=5501 RepID=A0A0J8RK29_COCIT|nr:hypothetical protein CIRG_07661 [Coccidioides immitis RMSCC 2394]KMU85172.1 hypothetical protein CIHG_02954 [Coccidioides immitis H538.4]
MSGKRLTRERLNEWTSILKKIWDDEEGLLSQHQQLLAHCLAASSGRKGERDESKRNETKRAKEDAFPREEHPCEGKGVERTSQFGQQFCAPDHATKCAVRPQQPPSAGYPMTVLRSVIIDSLSPGPKRQATFWRQVRGEQQKSPSGGTVVNKAADGL